MIARLRDPPSILEEAIGRVSTDVAAVSRYLLVYKALFEGEWFEALGRHATDPAERDVMHAIARDTFIEARAALEALAAWDAKRASAEDVVGPLRVRMLADLLHVKESTTEAFLLAGMRAPTDELRRAFVQLADLDRKHADALRELLGARRVTAKRTRPEEPRRGECAGAYEGRGASPSLSHALGRAIDELRADGQEPSGIVMSAGALRHARDEGILRPDDGTALGLPVEIDFGWRGECFAVSTLERVTLAEMISARGSAPPE